VGHLHELGAARDAGLDELDEARARPGVQGDVRSGGERVAVARVQITPIRPVRLAATARRVAGWITSTTGTG
jgi:hypothetical protein